MIFYIRYIMSIIKYIWNHLYLLIISYLLLWISICFIKQKYENQYYLSLQQLDNINNKINNYKSSNMDHYSKMIQANKKVPISRKNRLKFNINNKK